MHWKWKKRKVGLASVISRLEPSTLDSFCAAEHNFLRLPQLLSTLCNHDHHVKQIKSALARVALLRGTYEMHQSVPDHLDPKTLILIWDTGGSAGFTPFRSDFIDYVECEIDVCDVTKVNKVIGIGTLHCTNLLMLLAATSTCHVFPTIYQQLMSGCSLLRYITRFMVGILL